MSSVLTIGGSTITRTTAKIVLNRLTLSLDRPDELEFAELACDLPGSYAPEAAVTLTVDGTLSFSGWIFARHPDGFGQSSGRVGYRCLGLSYGASLVAVTASDGTGQMAFNLPITDPDYSEAEAGLDVGTMISQALAQHSTQLGAIGVSTDATTATQLAALTSVPPEPVYVSGNSLWVQLQQLLEQWYGSRYALRVEPSGLVRVWDTTSLTAKTITLDTDPAILTSMSEDTSECYTQVVLRGRADIEPAYLSLTEGTLEEGWTPTDEAAWTIDDFLQPKDGADIGDITAQTSTTITVQSDDGARTWAINYWSGIQGQVSVDNTSVAGVDEFEYRNITANTALTAGGTSTLTLDRALTATGFDRYSVRAVTPTSGLAGVWRKYTIPNTYVAQHLQQRFNHSVPFYTSGQGVAQVTGPVGVIEYSGFGFSGLQFPLNFEIIPYDGTTDGYLLFYTPVVMITTSNADLQAGGSAVNAPSDVIVLVPYSRGTLEVTSPSGGGYSGTAYSDFGVQRTLYRDYSTWVDAGNSGSMQILADAILATTSNAVREGSITYFDKYSDALPSGSWPIAINIAKATGTTSWESMAAPARTVTLEWPQEGAAIWTTRLSFSTRRQMFSGDRLYMHPMYGEGGFLSGVQGVVAPGGATFGGLAAGAHEVGFGDVGAHLAGASGASGLASAGEAATSGLASVGVAASEAMGGQLDLLSGGGASGPAPEEPPGVRDAE